MLPELHTTLLESALTIDAPEVSEELSLKLRASPISGEWRRAVLGQLASEGFVRLECEWLMDFPKEQRKLFALGLLATLGRPFAVFLRHGLAKAIGVDPTIEPHRVGGVGEIPFHIDFVNASRPPRHVAFLCERIDPAGGGENLVANFRRAADLTSAEALAILATTMVSEGRFYELGAVGHELKEFTMLEMTRGSIDTCRFTAKLLCEARPLDRRLLTAVSHFDQSLRAVATRVDLVPGDILILDQHKVCHARAALGDQAAVPSQQSRLLYQFFLENDS